MNPPLTNINYLRGLLKKKRLAPVRSAGQNFLVCEEVVEAILSVLAEGPKRVTELGAGVGTLTQGLLASGYRIKAIERDKRLSQILLSCISAKDKDQLNLLLGDLRDIAWEWDEDYSLVGNIPYNLSGLIIRRITLLKPMPALVVLLVQQEVAQRMIAQPPEMSLVSLAVQLWGSPHEVLQVPANCFWPEPKVSSTLVVLLPHVEGKEEATLISEREEIMAFAKPLFQQKRKQIGGGLRRLNDISEEQIAGLCNGSGVELTARPQELTLKQWKCLLSLLRLHKKSTN